LPLLIYETIYDSEAITSQNDGTSSKEVQMVDGGTTAATLKTEDDGPKVRFKEIAFSIETSDAEMIAVDGVAKAVGNAALPKATTGATTTTTEAETEKGKAKASAPSSGESEESSAIKTPGEAELSTEEEEMVAFLTSRYNAIKMLQSRIQVMSKYLESLPPSYLTGQRAIADGVIDEGDVNFQLLRSIQSLTNQIPMLVPADKESFEARNLKEKNDVSLVSLLGVVSKSVKDARELGRKYGVSYSIFSSITCWEEYLES
jgi:COP9 signalosome complex subunit 6